MHQQLKNVDPTQANPCVNPTHGQLWHTIVSARSACALRLLTTTCLWRGLCDISVTFASSPSFVRCKKVKVARTRLPSVRFCSWSRFSAVSLQVTWVINPTVGCHYFPPGLKLPPQSLTGLLPFLLLGEQRYNGCEQFAKDCCPTATRLRFEPGPFCAWVQHANHSAIEPPFVRCT